MTAVILGSISMFCAETERLSASVYHILRQLASGVSVVPAGRVER